MKLAERFDGGLVAVYRGAGQAIAEGICPLELHALTPLPVGNPEGWTVGDCACGRWTMEGEGRVIWYRPPDEAAQGKSEEMR